MLFLQLICICLHHLALVEVEGHPSCGTRQCIVCPDKQGLYKRIYIDCLVVNLTSNLSVISCNFTLNDSECEGSEIQMYDVVCHFSLKYVQSIGRWRYQSSFHFLSFSDPICDRVCDTHYQLASYEDIFKQEYECHCYEKNCNLLRNITISLVSTLQETASSVNLMSAYYTTTKLHSSPVIAATGNELEGSSINMYWRLTTTSRILSTTTTSSSSSSTKDIPQALSFSTSIDQRITNTVESTSHQVYNVVIATLGSALIFIVAIFLLTFCTLLYRKHVYKKSQYSPHHIPITLSSLSRTTSEANQTGGDVFEKL